MKAKNKRDASYIEKRINRAIDAMIDIQDRGYGSGTTAEILERLNSIHIAVSLARGRRTHEEWHKLHHHRARGRRHLRHAVFQSQ